MYLHTDLCDVQTTRPLFIEILFITSTHEKHNGNQNRLTRQCINSYISNLNIYFCLQVFVVNMLHGQQPFPEFAMMTWRTTPGKQMTSSLYEKSKYIILNCMRQALHHPLHLKYWEWQWKERTTMEKKQCTTAPHNIKDQQDSCQSQYQTWQQALSQLQMESLQQQEW